MYSVILTFTPNPWSTLWTFSHVLLTPQNLTQDCTPFRIVSCLMVAIFSLSTMFHLCKWTELLSCDDNSFWKHLEFMVSLQPWTLSLIHVSNRFMSLCYPPQLINFSQQEWVLTWCIGMLSRYCTMPFCLCEETFI